MHQFAVLGLPDLTPLVIQKTSLIAQYTLIQVPVDSDCTNGLLRRSPRPLEALAVRKRVHFFLFSFRLPTHSE